MSYGAIRSDRKRTHIAFAQGHPDVVVVADTDSDRSEILADVARYLGGFDEQGSVVHPDEQVRVEDRVERYIVTAEVEHPR